MELSEIDIIRAETLYSSLFFSKYHFKHRYNKKFVVNWHHELICEYLDKVFKGEIKKLAIRIAPRYGKTELAVINFISMGLALNPSSKFIHLSYSSDLALDNSEEIRDFVQTTEYNRLYPWVAIDKASTAKKKWYTTKGGGVYATSTGGQITGFGAGEMDIEDEELNKELIELSELQKNKFSGAIVIDDPLKPDDADSDIKRERINERFENTIRSRTNSRNTPIIIIGQAVHDRDLIGYLMNTEPNEWTLLSIPAISKDENFNDVALWSFKHTLEELYRIKENSPRTFDSQYQQDPKDLLGLLIPFDSLKFSKITNEPIYSMAFADPADEGGDKLSVIFIKIYFEDDRLLVYVNDVIHNNNGIEANTTRIIDKINEHNVSEIFIESNGLGLALILGVKRLANYNTKINPITSREPKTVRILSGFETVIKHFVFNEDYKKNIEFSHYISDLTKFKRDSTNTHKADAMDVTTFASNVIKIKFKELLFNNIKK